MIDKDLSGPAFPSHVTMTLTDKPAQGFQGDTLEPGKTTFYPGISRRDYFACSIVAAIIQCRKANAQSIDEMKFCATRAYKYADEMLQASGAQDDH